MAKVTIYVKNNCPYCERAQALLKRKGIDFDIINAGIDAILREEMITRAQGRTSFPQIFIDETPIGGCDDLYRLEETDRLDSLLAGEPPFGEAS